MTDRTTRVYRVYTTYFGDHDDFCHYIEAETPGQAKRQSWNAIRKYWDNIRYLDMRARLPKEGEDGPIIRRPHDAARG